MGHRVSKTTTFNEGSQVENTQAQAEAAEGAQNSSHHHHLAPSLVRTTHATEPSGLKLSTINLQIETPNAEELRRRAGEESNSPAVTATSPRQIIIKIQLAKMENEMQQQEQLLTECSNDNRSSSSNSNSNPLSNSNNNGTQFLNLTFNRNTPNDEFQTTADSNRLQQCSARSVDERTAGGSPSVVVNNNFSSNVVVTSSMAAGRHENFNILMAPMSELQIDDKRMSVASVVSSPSSSTTELAANSNAADCQAEAAGALSLAASNSCAEETAEDYCCRRKSKSSTFPNKSRCYKCTCRDAYKSIKNASTSKSSKKKEQKVSSPKSKEAQQHSSEKQQPLKTPLQTTGSPHSSGTAQPVVNNAAAATPSQMSIWSPSSNDVIISSPQFVVVQCPPSSVVTIDDNAIRLLATEMVAFHSNNPQRLLTTPADLNTTPAGGSIPTTSSSSIATPNREAGRGGGDGGRRRGGGAGAAAGVGGRKSNVPASGTVVHSQVDYIHCLVPDLERITKSSFYWGKMDRYEAERLLEGKAEGTFLLRDSAQEEYLFSVTFRKYGRSLHARIEQNNHKFSFDCHDPCVFTANTVTGLLEHYKDPACVMFFEPMLTIPLHRNTTFSLQQLCRATIASNTSYDGINELELPSRLKSYLKEYHYKQKLRVKPFDEAFYSCT